MQRFWMRGAVSGGLALVTAMTALMTAIPTTEARANDVTNNNITLSGGTGYFGALHTDDADFTDVFNFSIAGAISANMSLITIGSGLQNIDFISADLKGANMAVGIPLTFGPNGFLETGSLGDTAFTGPLVLTVRGKSGAGGGTSASYSGTINVTAVPEPSTALMMGLGLSGLGLAARRARPI